jgi:hypothetical protein
LLLLSSPLTLVLLSGDGVPGAASQLPFGVCTVSVVRLTCGKRVMAIAFLLKLASPFFASFVVDLNTLIAGDLRHEFA